MNYMYLNITDPEMKLSINNIEEFPEPTDLSPKGSIFHY